MRSTVPEIRAALRLESSGVHRRMTRSAFGSRFGSQYVSFFTSSARSRGTRRASRKGPVPDGAEANLFQSRPTFSHWVGLETRNHSI